MDNKFNLPWYIVNWLSEDDYDRISDTISVTGLIKPIRATALIKNAIANGVEIERDISDMFAARYGTMIHESMNNSIEKHDKPQGTILEKRFFSEIEKFTITGKIDAVLDGVIHDFKSTSVYKWINRDFEDYVRQLSIYKWLLTNNGIFVPDFAVIDFFFTDWSRSKSLYDSEYPNCRYGKQLIHLWKHTETEDWIKERLRGIVDAQKELPLCPEEELWVQPTVYAHMRNGRKSAVKKYDNIEEANQAVLDGKLGDYVEHRPGCVRRCNYCDAKSICSQYQGFVEQGRIQE